MSAIDFENGKKDPENVEKIVSYIRHLEKKIKNYEMEVNLLRNSITKEEFEIKSLRGEIDRLSELPLLSGYITDILDDNNDRAIVDSPPSSSFIVRISNRLQNEKIVTGLHVGLNQRNYAVMEILPSNFSPFVRGMEIIDSPIDVSYEDVGGLENQIQEVKEIIELPLKRPDLFDRIGIEPPKGVLFYGLPGTGKTLLAKAVAHESNATFIKVVATELVQKFIGEGSQYVREIFSLARQKAPTILFIDELDAIGAIRMQDDTSGDREVNRTLMQLLSELDGFDQRGDIKFIGATNRSDILDPALLRPGRFDRLVEFPVPNEKAREAIFRVHMRNLHFEENIEIKELSNLTQGATGSDIKGICTEAGMYAIRRNSEIISNEDFIIAIDKVLSKKEEDIQISDLFI
ncbi:MAG: proteasome-activating nucleotidase [Candidatus Hodarchaeota archaeon]